MTKKHFFLPLLVVGIGILGAVGMIAARPKVETRPPEAQPPLVRVATAEAQDLQFRVRAQGSVAPRTEGSIVPEISGRVEWVSPILAPGGFFEKGDPLLRIDSSDYAVALRHAEASVARGRSESRLAAANLKRSRDLADRGVVSAAELDSAENAARVAEAMLLEADISVEKARLDLERAEIRAPYAGRVRDKNVDVGQFVNRGTPVGTIYAVDFAEVRLPIPDDQLAYVDLPLNYRGEADVAVDRPMVMLHSRIAGVEHTWEGYIVRTEGEIDPHSRMIHAVAQVENPYSRGGDHGRPPLAVGLFVEAEILGREVHDVIVLPRAAMRGEDRVLVVDDEERLHFRTVEVVRADRDQVILGGGIRVGERVTVSPLEAAVDGMRVRVAPGPRSAAPIGG
jgi:RND family efflux transporter MFP subunit